MDVTAMERDEIRSMVRAHHGSAVQAPRRALKMYHLRALENVPGVGGQLKVYHPT